jgi:hypothetical protein
MVKAIARADRWRDLLQSGAILDGRQQIADMRSPGKSQRERRAQQDSFGMKPRINRHPS